MTPVHPNRRPWGYFEVVARGTRWQTKTLVIDPGSSTSLQRHHQRSEYWLVGEGTAMSKQRAETVKGELVFGDRMMVEGDTAVIAASQWHQITNPGKIPLVLVEVWTGSHLSEDDIERTTLPQTAGTNR